MKYTILILTALLTACAQTQIVKPDPLADCWIVTDAQQNFLGCMRGAWPVDPDEKTTP